MLLSPIFLMFTLVVLLQLDDQLPDAVYPVIFSPTPLPKSVAAESGRRLFSTLRRLHSA